MDFSSIDFIDLLERIGLSNARMTAGGVEINYSCHRGEHSHGDESPSSYLNSNTGMFFCHGCKFSGSVVILISDVQQVSQATAERFLRDTYGLQFDEPVDGSFLVEIENRLRPLTPPIHRTPPPESWLTSVCVDWRARSSEPFQKYMFNRGLSLNTLSEWEIGYDYLSNRITIPIRDLDGELFGVKGRDWEGTHPAKYLGIGDRPGAQRLRYGFSTYEITEVVFGLHRARNVHWTVLHEGEINALALWQMGIPRPTALGTSGMSEHQRRLIIDEVDLAYVFLDAGAEDHAREIAGRLEPFVRVKVVEPLPFDPCDALRDGREDEVLRTIDEARSSFALSTAFG